MHIMGKIQAVQAALETDTPFLHATNMEDPLASIRHLATAICLLCEGMEEPYGSVVQHLGWSIRDNLNRLDKEHSFFFHLHHPVPEHNQEGSPSDGEEPECA
jgi:hypothetical protein